jgi:hypothetical protein
VETLPKEEVKVRNTKYSLLCLSLLFVGQAGTTFAAVIDFETLSGPSTFAAAGNAQTLTIATGIGPVMFGGGVILTNATNLSADETSIYGTAGNAANIGVTIGTGFTNPLTIIFPVPISNFFLDVLNGNTINVNYRVGDNSGNSANFLLMPNLSGGQKTIGFAAAGTIVTVAATTGQSTSTGQTWDFFIDNIHFNEALPPNLTPEPADLTLVGTGLAGFLLLRRVRRA